MVLTMVGVLARLSSRLDFCLRFSSNVVKNTFPKLADAVTRQTGSQNLFVGVCVLGEAENKKEIELCKIASRAVTRETKRIPIYITNEHTLIHGSFQDTDSLEDRNVERTQSYQLRAVRMERDSTDPSWQIYKSPFRFGQQIILVKHSYTSNTLISPPNKKRKWKENKKDVPASSGNDIRDEATCHFDFPPALDAAPQTSVTQQKPSSNPQQALSSPTPITNIDRLSIGQQMSKEKSTRPCFSDPSSTMSFSMLHISYQLLSIMERSTFERDNAVKNHVAAEIARTGKRNRQAYKARKDVNNFWKNVQHFRDKQTIPYFQKQSHGNTLGSRPCFSSANEPAETAKQRKKIKTAREEEEEEEEEDTEWINKTKHAAVAERFRRFLFAAVELEGKLNKPRYGDDKEMLSLKTKLFQETIDRVHFTVQYSKLIYTKTKLKTKTARLVPHSSHYSSTIDFFKFINICEYSETKRFLQREVCESKHSHLDAAILRTKIHRSDKVSEFLEQYQKNGIRINDFSGNLSGYFEIVNFKRNTFLGVKSHFSGVHLKNFPFKNVDEMEDDFVMKRKEHMLIRHINWMKDKVRIGEKHKHDITNEECNHGREMIPLRNSNSISTTVVPRRVSESNANRIHDIVSMGK
ncbi:hypothetical protein WN51_10781 [Melipona quadrifasciata]|uniref:Uncharacterized protein n=1 Tax=Melipona quadrifasciata TaxID=166423 RepID=A0A0M9A497_9HYME|nr:hypothetical protein WN51_10781 [Melipona quadrifasciata]